MSDREQVRPDYDKAADYWEFWRKQQEVKLTEKQKVEFARITKEQAEQRRELQSKAQKERMLLVEAEKRRLLLNKPELALRMLPLKPLKEYRARYLAEGTVDRRQASELTALDGYHRREKDDFLNRSEQEREAEKLTPDNEQLKETFSRMTERRNREREQERQPGRDRER
jgi:hypothetical protein